MVEVSSLTPAMVAKRRSSGSATVEAMISGLAPAMVACTTIDRQGDVRERRDRQVEIGRAGPTARCAIARSEVATGRLMKSAGMFTRRPRLQGSLALRPKRCEMRSNNR